MSPDETGFLRLYTERNKHLVFQPWVCHLCSRVHAEWWCTTPPPSCRARQEEHAAARQYEKDMMAPLSPELRAALLERLRTEAPLVVWGPPDEPTE